MPRKPPAPARCTKAGTSKAAAADRRRLFVLAYLANGRNGTQAAIEAGYSPKTAYSAAERLLKHVEIRRELAAVAQQSLEAAGLTVERTLEELASVTYANPRRLFGPDNRGKRLEELDKATAAALAHVELDAAGRITSFRFWDKNAALEKAMKHLGLYERDNAQRGESLSVTVKLL